MQRPLLFVATSDPDFADTVLDATMETRHGVRKARDIRHACQLLGLGMKDITLAIVDLDFNDRGLSLLRILGGCGPEFPILVVTDNSDSLKGDETIATIPFHCLSKPVSVANLQSMIRELSAEGKDQYEASALPAFMTREPITQGPVQPSTMAIP
jgi:DNA-binding NtrC family response regulator